MSEPSKPPTEPEAMRERFEPMMRVIRELRSMGARHVCINAGSVQASWPEPKTTTEEDAQ